MDSFAQRIHNATLLAYQKSAPFIPSKAEVHDALQPVIDDLLTMPKQDAWHYICASFHNVGNQAFALRLFNDQSK
jgi:hypothetical protein